MFREVAQGDKTDRAQLARLLDKLAAGDVLLVTRLDRLARSTRDLLNALAAITDRKAGFRSLGDAWADTTTPHGRLMLTVLGGLAEFERDLIRARTSEGRERAKARGVKLGRKPKLTDHQKREAIRRRDIDGETVRDIARSYNVSITSRMAHQQFDKLAGIDPAKRTREDRLPTSLLTTIEKWLADSGADDLAKWSHAYLAHAGGPEARKRIADLTVTANKITDAIKALARVTEAISACLLFASGRTNALMPVAQFNQFEKLDKPIIQAGGEADAYKLWHQLSDERNNYLDGVDAELIGRARARPGETSGVARLGKDRRNCRRLGGVCNCSLRLWHMAVPIIGKLEA